jgi:hypothetical protein
VQRRIAEILFAVGFAVARRSELIPGYLALTSR